MDRRTLATLVGATLFVALLSTLLYTSQKPRAVSKPAVNANSGATPSTSAPSAAASGDLMAIPPANESIQHRRERMASNKAYRDDFKLSEQDVYLYVQAKGSNAISLVTAFESSRNKDYLKAAIEQYPNDPFVQAKALMWLDLSPEEHARMVEDFKKSAPTNAFPNLLAAQDAMKRGDTQTALAELAAAKNKSYDEYDRESMEGLQDAYLSAGRSVAEAKTLGMAEITLPELAQFKGLGRQFIDLAEKAAAEGDTKTQQDMLRVSWEIGEKLRTGAGVLPIIEELVGMALQNATLSKWPAGVDFDGRTAADVLAANSAARKELQGVGPMFDKWFPTAPDEEIVTYMDTIKSSGERQAVAWLKEQHPEFAQLQPKN